MGEVKVGEWPLLVTRGIGEGGRTGVNCAEAGRSPLVWDRKEGRVGEESVQQSQVRRVGRVEWGFLSSR